MIVSHEREYVNFAIPRTASRATAEWLQVVCDGISPRHIPPRTGPRSHHRIDIPDEYAGYRRFAVIREPVSRWESAWRAAHRRDQLRIQTAEEYNRAFLDHLHRMIDDRGTKNPRCFEAAQTTWVETCEIDTLLLYEDLPTCLDSLWFVRPGEIDQFPVVGKTQQPRWPVSQECIDFVRAKVPQDFELYERVRAACRA